jgi:hypothetical protein
MFYGKKIFYFLIILYSSLIINIFGTDDATNDMNKKKYKPEFSFYNKEKINFEVSTSEISTLYLLNELYISVGFPIKSFKITPWIDDMFLVDFLPVTAYPTPFSATDLLYNSLIAGVDSSVKIQRIMNIYLNFEVWLNTPFYDNLSLYFKPLLGFYGDYYYGFYWNIEQSVPIDFTPATGSTIISIQNYTKAAYEFFRFYGPKNFKFTIAMENTLNIYIPVPVTSNYYENKFTAGAYFTLYGFTLPDLYFVLDAAGYFYSTTNLPVGFKAGFSYTGKRIYVSASYTGTKDLINLALPWLNRIELFVKFKINF